VRSLKQKQTNNLVRSACLSFKFSLPRRDTNLVVYVHLVIAFI